MPVVHVRALERTVADPDRLLLSIARAVAEAARCPIQDVWCTWTPVARISLGEQLVDSGSIVYVDLLMRERRKGVAERVLEAAAAAAAEASGVPIEDVWIRYEPVEAGRLFAGGGFR